MIPPCESAVDHHCLHRLPVSCSVFALAREWARYNEASQAILAYQAKG